MSVSISKYILPLCGNADQCQKKKNSLVIHASYKCLHGTKALQFSIIINIWIIRKKGINIFIQIKMLQKPAAGKIEQNPVLMLKSSMDIST